MSWMERLKKMEMAQGAGLQKLQKPLPSDPVDMADVVLAEPPKSESPPDHHATKPTETLFVDFVASPEGLEDPADTEAAAWLELLVNRGLALPVAEAAAAALASRDADMDDRRCCLECVHGGGTRCPDGAPLAGLHPDGLPLLHRCAGFAPVEPLYARPAYFERGAAGLVAERQRQAAWWAMLAEVRAADAAAGPRMLRRAPVHILEDAP